MEEKMDGRGIDNDRGEEDEMMKRRAFVDD
jgi:hypothetical protein